ncbi:hypothetical protein FRC02_004830 [Tulasnella sp. 418]|nr:hypothetical protein FRC02_004830 [Tulasnella sp. 418]
MWFLEAVRHGRYIDPMDRVNPAVLQQFYRVDDGMAQARHHNSEDIDSDSDSDDATTSGSSDESDDDESSQSTDGNDSTPDILSPAEKQELEKWIQDAQQHNVRHAAVKNPPISSPFNKDQKRVFQEILDRMERKNVIPEGFSVGDYNPIEFILVGKQRESPIDLPIAIWLPTEIRWVHALEVMEWLMAQNE